MALPHFNFKIPLETRNLSTILLLDIFWRADFYLKVVGSKNEKNTSPLTE
jgi:hypothetical protein